MNKNLGFAIAFAICVLAAATIIGTNRPTPVVHAQDKACDASSLSGAYGYSLNGSVYDSQGYVYLLGAAGRMVSDGNGNLTGADTFSLDGTQMKRQYTGTYTMNSDCTGSLTFTTSSGTTTGINSFHADLVPVNNAKEVNLVQTDGGFILTGVLKLQNQ